jgi:hypothetical protein
LRPAKIAANTAAKTVPRTNGATSGSRSRAELTVEMTKINARLAELRKTLDGCHPSFAAELVAERDVLRQRYQDLELAFRSEKSLANKSRAELFVAAAHDYLPGDMLRALIDMANDLADEESVDEPALGLPRTAADRIKASRFDAAMERRAAHSILRAFVRLAERRPDDLELAEIATNARGRLPAKVFKNLDTHHAMKSARQMREKCADDLRAAEARGEARGRESREQDVRNGVEFARR